ncbi:hypothetical protein [Streptomyces sp. A1547]|uniref:hypothetical protein n=1 Tax=Streptomyces sp. A1547 TaxID=2563105 RepID=UPI00109E6775|nr:hypothetical protein [Streptomyces sp. A1547]THA31394.1 hypothetical protein E6W17_35930 [Streptomyces sp. A1547]
MAARSPPARRPPGQWLLALRPPVGVVAVALVSMVAAVHSLLAQAALGAGALDGTPARPGLLPVPAPARRPPCAVHDLLLGRS